MSKAKAPKSDKREDVLVSARVKVPPAPPRPERGGPPNEEAGLSACTLTDMCWQCARCGAVKLLDGAQPGWKWRSEGPSHWLHRCQTAAELEAAEVEDCTTAPQDQVAKCHDLLGRVVPPGELPQRIAWLMASWRELTRRGASAGAAHVQAKPAESEFVTVKGLLDKEAEARLLADLAKRAAAHQEELAKCGGKSSEVPSHLGALGRPMVIDDPPHPPPVDEQREQALWLGIRAARLALGVGTGDPGFRALAGLALLRWSAGTSTW
jgi:hypothetical protein